MKINKGWAMRYWTLGMGVGGMLLPLLAMAQSGTGEVRGSGERIQNYYEQRQKLAPEAEVADPVVAPAAAEGPLMAADAGLSFQLTEVSFSPSVFLPADELQGFAAPFIGQQIGMTELEEIVSAVNAAYASREITTARARLGSQQIDGGVVHVELVEGRLGQLEITGDARVPERFVRQRIRQQPGEVVQTNALREDLVYLNRTSDLTVRALLRPGEAVGQTDIVLQAQTPSRRVGGVFVDNAGVETTGRERIGVQGHVWGLAGINDLLAGSVAYAEGGLEGRVSYSGLLNRRNGRVGLSVSRNQINIIDGAYRQLDITGESTSYSLDLRQPWIANQHWLFSSSGSLARSRSSTDISGIRVSEVESTIVTIGMNLGYRNTGYEWSLQQSVSRINVDEPLRTRKDFTIANGGFTWMQRLGSTGLLYRTQLGWQVSDSDFAPSGNLFQAGGVGSVRGYVRGAIAGPKGYYANLELHRPYKGSHDAYLFVDHAGIRGDQPRSADINSVGVGLSGQFGSRYSYSLDVGHPLDTVTDDQDSVRADFRIAATWR
ncbi:ShlB/FhaC/HecB family hemolysin secretion/activation protein [Lysobacter ciconiae]|uniref:ShlB/FhaC/HecB family hemolysin secretion/activation protein n=1 Tax=Novilysobacter ciconiae TaxID=2781022 RepID=A0A7S6UEG8_9GAMM|nr:ShlB/FhaC/HecB family hemolysin secretion/activation protein [Lysobacter ciconiae]QOW18775.1 ShlB/FhaC/HecB family hemolysin secretion/activation protein [Lysobacter ciconiae]